MSKQQPYLEEGDHIKFWTAFDWIYDYVDVAMPDFLTCKNYPHYVDLSTTGVQKVENETEFFDNFNKQDFKNLMLQ